MSKYIVIDDLTSSSAICETKEYDRADEAIREAIGDFKCLSPHDMRRRDAFFVLESVNPDEDAEDHFDGTTIWDCKNPAACFQMADEATAPKKLKIFAVGSTESGYIIEYGLSYQEALDTIKEYEALDKGLESYEEGFYSVYQQDITLSQFREMTGMSQKAFADYFGIPVRTVQEWNQGRRSAPDYVLGMMMRIYSNEK